MNWKARLKAFTTTLREWWHDKEQGDVEPEIKSEEPPPPRPIDDHSIPEKPSIRDSIRQPDESDITDIIGTQPSAQPDIPPPQPLYQRCVCGYRRLAQPSDTGISQNRSAQSSASPPFKPHVEGGYSLLMPEWSDAGRSLQHPEHQGGSPGLPHSNIIMILVLACSSAHYHPMQPVFV